MEVAAKKAWPCMKQLAGCPNLPGTRITIAAFFTTQSARSGVTAIEQIRTKAVSIAGLLWPRDRLIAVRPINITFRLVK
jgi:hypothetical protein